jgi:hypothetical protein
MEKTLDRFTCKEESDLARFMHIIFELNEFPKETRQEFKDLFLKFRSASREQAITDAVAVLKHERDGLRSPEYAGGPIGAFSEIFACNKCIEALQALKASVPRSGEEPQRGDTAAQLSRQEQDT